MKRKNKIYLLSILALFIVATAAVGAIVVASSGIVTNKEIIGVSTLKNESENTYVDVFDQNGDYKISCRPSSLKKYLLTIVVVSSLPHSGTKAPEPVGPSSFRTEKQVLYTKKGPLFLRGNTIEYEGVEYKTKRDVVPLFLFISGDICVQNNPMQVIFEQ